MHTEAEARTKWCPFARREGDYLSRQPVNRPVDNNSRCLASQCMAWRWTTEPLDTRYRQETGQGFCGLAGKVG